MMFMMFFPSSIPLFLELMKEIVKFCQRFANSFLVISFGNYHKSICFGFEALEHLLKLMAQGWAAKERGV